MRGGGHPPQAGGAGTARTERASPAGFREIASLGPVRDIRVADLTPYPGNARKISDKAVEQCAASIREFGWQQPLVGREAWHGPTEDDILHSIQYGSSPAGVTSAVVSCLHYRKPSGGRDGGRDGMRAHYDQTRSVGLQRVAPQAAGIRLRQARANGAPYPRVFHTMTGTSIRNPLVIRDRVLYAAAAGRVSQLGRDAMEDFRAGRLQTVDARAARLRRGADGAPGTAAEPDQPAASQGGDEALAHQPPGTAPAGAAAAAPGLAQRPGG